MTITIVVIFILLMLSAFFSGSETALTAASKPVMHHKEQDGDQRAGIVNRLRQYQERLLGAILLGNNMVNILASALATSVMIELFGERGVVYATAGMTVLVLVFSEILPKTYALQHADSMALRVARPMSILVVVFGPVTQTIQVVVRATLRLFGSGEGPGTDSERELRGAIELHADDVVVGDHHAERTMLHGVLDLEDVGVWEIMVHRRKVQMIDITRPIEEILDTVLASPHTRIPIYDKDPDNIVGVLHAREALKAIVRGSKPETAEDVRALSAVPWFIPDSTTLADQLKAFKERHEHFAIVIDEYGAFEGVVSLEDILEEIVGDIADETDVEVVGVQPQTDGSVIVRGDVTIRDLNRRFGWRLPDEEAATVAGLLLYETRRIPDVGQQFRFHGLEFEVLRRIRNQVTRIKLREVSEVATDELNR
ncbi:HlyC/CorC family transporter [Thalassospira alkalitolerans]|uniref:Membrane protein n=1 Tax=Thalassospira alkalitolerans TaxID=1293890 RepID=A0A1Y2L9T8_9PROT|nr:HlyC/CorC family transporter [Thalassospira alkalitolerans]OSQ47064.1 membrane protein [Thalassospira alkalitolerans]|tara:strand:- start:77942 stop:79219 length:1278 start_codon:yes stop_codon:yes gene_type:complete